MIIVVDGILVCWESIEKTSIGSMYLLCKLMCQVHVALWRIHFATCHLLPPQDSSKNWIIHLIRDDSPSIFHLLSLTQHVDLIRKTCAHQTKPPEFLPKNLACLAGFSLQRVHPVTVAQLTQPTQAVKTDLARVEFMASYTRWLSAICRGEIKGPRLGAHRLHMLNVSLRLQTPPENW